MNITRRLFLNTAAASAVAATSIPSAAAVADASSRQRLQAAIAEVKAIALEIWPDINQWTDIVFSDDDGPYTQCPLMLVGHKPALPPYLEWSGPGVYELQRDKTRPIYYVERVWSATDGEWLYRGCHWWKAKHGGPFVHFGADEQLKIIRKVRDVGEGWA